jgi:NTP pyrophosphatase (non-canonical NTP hydrolase)
MPATVTNADLRLTQSPTLADFQEYVRKIKIARDFKNDKMRALILLSKEVGELAQATRKTWANPDHVPLEDQREIAMELADVFIYLLDTANQYQIDLELAFREKEEINKQRVWPKYYHE